MITSKSLSAAFFEEKWRTLNYFPTNAKEPKSKAKPNWVQCHQLRFLVCTFDKHQALHLRCVWSQCSETELFSTFWWSKQTSCPLKLISGSQSAHWECWIVNKDNFDFYSNQAGLSLLLCSRGGTAVHDVHKLRVDARIPEEAMVRLSLAAIAGFWCSRTTTKLSTFSRLFWSGLKESI